LPLSPNFGLFKPNGKLWAVSGHSGNPEIASIAVST
jgi:hypothetical protein